MSVDNDRLVCIFDVFVKVYLLLLEIIDLVFKEVNFVVVEYKKHLTQGYVLVVWCVAENTFEISHCAGRVSQV